MFLMGGFSTASPLGKRIIEPLTPEQSAKKAERLAQIGLKGELFIMKYEKEKLVSLGINDINYPRHVALESMCFGYDVLSLDEFNNEIYIEVKTTTRSKEDKYSKTFFISTNEYKVFSDNKSRYKLYRVYDVENSPTTEILDLNNIKIKPDGYICEY